MKPTTKKLYFTGLFSSNPCVNGIEFTSDRIVNPDDADPEMVARYGYKGFILTSLCGVMAVVFARHLEEALDLAADGEFLNAIKVDVADMDDEECDRYNCLGNYGDYYDLMSYFGFTEFDASKGMEAYELCLA